MRFPVSRTQRVVALLPLLVLALALAQSAVGSGVAVTATAWAQDAPKPPADVDVTIKTTEEHWYLSPIWLGIGAAVLIGVVALLVAGSRNSTTVVK